MSPVSRRDFVVRGLCGCALSALASGTASARVQPSQMTPLVTAGYKPVDVDERGLWQECDKLEEQLATSGFLIRDPALTSYVRRVAERLLGALAADLRIYLVRDPDFNASMAPNGMMIVHSGLLVRVHDEAQLAAILGHESGHYLRRHSLRKWRENKTQSAIATTAATLAQGVAPGAAGLTWSTLAYGLSNGLLLAFMSYSREMEIEADAYGIKLLNDAGYDPEAAAEIWTQVIEEREASASGRNMRYSGESRSPWSTHPPTAHRMMNLSESAIALHSASADPNRYKHGREEWLQVSAGIRPMLLDEQVKLNDPGASLYLINNLAAGGWDGVLHYYEGEVYRLRDTAGDAERAAKAYSAAIQHANAPPEAYRAHGYAQLKAGNAEQGRQALMRYLELHPGAPDAPMVRYTLGQ